MSLNVKFINSISEIPQAEWQALVKTDYPFIQYEFLNLMEITGAVSPENSWEAHHLCVYEDDILIAAMPLYKKTNWFGEYVFDWAWEEAYLRYGYHYYPKLTACIPFTPVTGPRLLARGNPTSELIEFITNALMHHCQQSQFTSVHLLFPDKELSNQLEAFDWQQRRNVQFQWYNYDYANFDDFLATFTSRKRKNLNKERRKLQGPEFEIQRLSGDLITTENLQFFYRCYQQTYLKRSGHCGYLNKTFFEKLLVTCKDNLLLVLAKFNEAPVAGALYFKDSQNLYGRYWGTLVDIDGLHFECCYYQGIEYCIEQGLKMFNPGTQGEHKIQRGFEPTFCYSNHWLKEPMFHRAITNFVLEEGASIDIYKEQSSKLLPFKSPE